MSRPLLTAAELASHLKVTRRWIYDQVESHDMPAYRLGPRALRFDLRAVEVWLEGRKVGDWQTSPKSCVSPISRVPL
jgi:excisionase family DNA binding protein